MIIDELVLEIELQRKDFEKGVADVLSKLDAFKGDLTKRGDAVEKEAKRTADGIAGLRNEAKTLFVLLAGGFTISGIKSFTDSLNQMDAALGRFAANLGTAPDRISAWGQAVERMGGNSQAASASLQTLYDKMWRFTNLGENLPKAFWIGLAQGGVSDKFLQTKDTLDRMLLMGQAIQRIAAEKGRDAGAAVGRNAFGLDEGTINLFLEKGPRLQEFIEGIRRESAADQSDTDAAKKLQESWVSLSQTITDFGRKVLTAAEPYLEGILKDTEDFLNTWDRAKIKTEVDDFARYMGNEGGKGIKDFFTDVAAATIAIGRGLWAFAGAVRSVASLFGVGDGSPGGGGSSSESDGGSGSSPSSPSGSSGSPGFFTRNYRRLTGQSADAGAPSISSGNSALGAHPTASGSVAPSKSDPLANTSSSVSNGVTPTPGSVGPGAETGPEAAARLGIRPTANQAANLGIDARNLTTIRTRSGANIVVASKLAAQWRGFLNELENTGYYINPKVSGGYNPGSMLGGLPSQHALGNAVDINPFSAGNLFNSAGTNNLPKNVGQIADKWGLAWGGYWHGNRDAMHFEGARYLTPDQIAALSVSSSIGLDWRKWAHQKVQNEVSGAPLSAQLQPKPPINKQTAVGSMDFHLPHVTNAKQFGEEVLPYLERWHYQGTPQAAK